MKERNKDHRLAKCYLFPLEAPFDCIILLFFANVLVHVLHVPILRLILGMPGFELGCDGGRQCADLEKDPPRTVR